VYTSDAVVLLLSPFVGSFLGVVIDRLPEGRPVLWDRSTCDHCGRHLSPLALVPLVSYLVQRGRCRDCGQAIGRFYPLIEFSALAVALSAVLLVPGWPLWASLYLGWSLLVLAWIDARHRVLPDAINLPLIPAGLLVTALLSPGLLPAHLIGAVLGFASLAAVAWLYRRFRGRDGLGLGDAKLFAAAGAWLGWQALPGVLLSAALAALTVALARSAFGDRLQAADEIAFGPYLALALWAGWLLGPLTLW
jgi:leader peptidase (prepilin peptidase)/N-methyltransferase